MPADNWYSCTHGDPSFGALTNGRSTQLRNVPLQKYLLTLYMDLSNEGLNLQVINVINNSFMEYMRQSVQICRGKRQEILITCKVQTLTTYYSTFKVQIRKLKFYSGISSSSRKDHSSLIRDVMF